MESATAKKKYFLFLSDYNIAQIISFHVSVSQRQCSFTELSLIHWTLSEGCSQSPCLTESMQSL